MNSVRLLTGGNTARKAVAWLRNSLPVIVSHRVCRQFFKRHYPRLNLTFHVCELIPQRAACQHRLLLFPSEGPGSARLKNHLAL